MEDHTVRPTTSASAMLNGLEEQRKTLSALKVRSYIFLGTGVLITGGGIFLGGPVTVLLICGAIPLITGIVMAAKNSSRETEYQHQFKQTFIASALKEIDPSLQIDASEGLSESDFVATRLFSHRPDRYHSEDQIYGTAGKTRFSFSEVHAEYKTVTRTKNGTQEHWHTILKGIVFCADFNKNFRGNTIVSPRDIGDVLSSWISSAIPIFSRDELVKLENPTFTRTFSTYSNDQVEARYILTPALMERICELNDRCSQTISLSFTADHIFIAFPLNKNYFEAPVFKTLLDPDLLQEDLALIRFMYGIIHELDLNTRIWGKN